MQKSAPSFGRIAAMVVFALSCFALVLFLWLAFGGPIPLKPKGYRFTASFAEASQLATEADVRISGVPVGKVKAIEPDRATGRSVVTIELASKYAPLPSDAKALLRQKTLLGETYVELTPGTSSAPPLPEGGQLADAQVGETVELDELLRAFDPRTRAAFRVWMQSQAEAITGNGRNLNEALGNLAPFAEDASVLVDILNRQEPALRRLVANTGVVFGALNERDGQLRSLIENSERVFATTAARDDALRQAFVALPTFERESRATIARLTSFARTTDPLVTQLRPAARQLAPTLDDVAALAPDLESFFRDLGPLIDASAAGFPAAERILRDLVPLLGQLDPVLRQVNPVLFALGNYKRELTAFFANTVAATQAAVITSAGRVHYLRTTNPFGPENLAAYPRRIGTNRTNPYTLPGHFDKLREGLDSYETRQCTPPRGIPVVDNTPQPYGDGTFSYPQSLIDQVLQFGFPAGNTHSGPAPPCRQQAKFPLQGALTQYPQLKADP
jgi:phospholipid/cholesterol/gamma-HCH transport system substrate-binding protein